MDKLSKIFNPEFSLFFISDYRTKEEQKEFYNNRTEFEKEIYEEIYNGLISDIEKNGLPITYASKIIINEVALNITLISRIKFFLINTEPIADSIEYKLDNVTSKKDGKEKNYKYDAYSAPGEKISKVYTYVLTLQKEINKQLKLLGLLPEQQARREKIAVVEQLRKRLFDVENGDVKHSAEVISERKESLV